MPRDKAKDKEHVLRKMDEGAVLERAQATGWFLWPGSANKIGWSYSEDGVVDDAAIDELVQEAALTPVDRGRDLTPSARLTDAGRRLAKGLRKQM